MRIVFFGTPDFAAPSLRAILKEASGRGVVTRPTAPGTSARSSSLRRSRCSPRRTPRGAAARKPVATSSSPASAASTPTSRRRRYGHILARPCSTTPRLGMTTCTRRSFPCSGERADPVGDRQRRHRDRVSIMRMEAGSTAAPCAPRGDADRRRRHRRLAHRAPREPRRERAHQRAHAHRGRRGAAGGAGPRRRHVRTEARPHGGPHRLAGRRLHGGASHPCLRSGARRLGAARRR